MWWSVWENTATTDWRSWDFARAIENCLQSPESLIHNALDRIFGAWVKLDATKNEHQEYTLHPKIVQSD